MQEVSHPYLLGNLQPRSKSWLAKILSWLVTSSLFKWLTFDFSATLKSFDYHSFVGVFAIFCTHLHCLIISWCGISTAAKETTLEMIKTPKTRLQLDLYQNCKLCTILYNTVFPNKFHFKIDCGNITCYWPLPKIMWPRPSTKHKSMPVSFDFCFDHGCRLPYSKHGCDTPCLTSVGPTQAHSN